jgi:hypothetical protein
MHSNTDTADDAVLQLNLDGPRVRRWVGWLYGIALGVVGVSLLLLLIRRHIYSGFPIHQLDHVFQLNRESSVPTWVSSVLLLMAATAAGVIARQGWVQRWRFRWHWAGLAALLALMSLDEVATMHEQLTEPFRANFGFDGLLFYAWVVPVGLGLLVLGLIYLPFVLALPRRTRGLCLTAAALAIGGGLILEMIGGSYHAADAMGSPAYLALMAAEETLELLAWVTVLWALLDYQVAAPRQARPARPARAALETPPLSPGLEHG